MFKMVLACDLSLTCPAFAVMKFDLKNKTVDLIEVNHIKTNSKRPLGYRLDQIAMHLQGLLDKYPFDDIVLEKGFNRFAVATQQLQRVVGITVITIYRKGYEGYGEIAPTSVKKHVTGNGKATKEELAKALYSFVKYDDYKTNDESDAVGVGIALGKQKGWI